LSATHPVSHSTSYGWGVDDMLEAQAAIAKAKNEFDDRTSAI